MLRPPWGVYVETGSDVIRDPGRRKPVDPPGLDWHDGLSVAARATIDANEDSRLLRWDGATVRLRSRPARAAIAADDVTSADDAWIDDERRTALVEGIVSEVNAADGGLITTAAVRAAYKKALSR